MGNDYKTFLGVPGSFFLHGWQCFFCSWAVPGGLWGHESGHVYDAPSIIFKPYRALPLSPRTEPHCRLPCQTIVPRILVWIPLPHAQSWSKHCECCLVCLAVLRRHWTQQVQKRMLLFARNHALHPWTLSLCVCMPALVVAVLIAYAYECARKLSASLFLGSQKQAFLASWLWALIVIIYVYIHTHMWIRQSLEGHVRVNLFTAAVASACHWASRDSNIASISNIKQHHSFAMAGYYESSQSKLC